MRYDTKAVLTPLGNGVFKLVKYTTRVILYGLICFITWAEKPDPILGNSWSQNCDHWRPRSREHGFVPPGRVAQAIHEQEGLTQGRPAPA